MALLLLDFIAVLNNFLSGGLTCRGSHLEGSKGDGCKYDPKANQECKTVDRFEIPLSFLSILSLDLVK